MDFEVYCDEAYPDLFTTQKSEFKYLMIGSLWIQAELRSEIKDKIEKIRNRYNIHGEIKWTKVSPSSLEFYKSLVNMYVDYGLDMRFRCIAIDKDKFSVKWHKDDAELGFYKFYYQLLKHWILDFNKYSIFCDIKTNKDPRRLQSLKVFLEKSNLSSQISSVQSLPSKQVVLIQMSDLLLGMAAFRMNKSYVSSEAKKELVEHLEKRLKRRMLIPTNKNSDKFNIFKINLQGGW